MSTYLLSYDAPTPQFSDVTPVTVNGSPGPVISKSILETVGQTMGSEKLQVSFVESQYSICPTSRIVGFTSSKKTAVDAPKSKV